MTGTGIIRVCGAYAKSYCALQVFIEQKEPIMEMMTAKMPSLEAASPGFSHARLLLPNANATSRIMLPPLATEKQSERSAALP